MSNQREDDDQCKKAGCRAKGKQPEEHVNGVMLSFVRRSGAVINVPIYNARLDGLFERMLLTDVAKSWQSRINSVLKDKAGKELPA